ncbi:outer membrane protein assembly factor BamB family protein [Parenemella sanctibonifatiensis]|uniref:Pyrrolo-quinoline quinone repeat domain-containing protein n=1 Tax=Parenemella sanctibonifatiensis TaxID=2016505 RepID=A0A255E0T9_9ACTN|nr:PQQ-binding-like beta-propeller repeat protein [Parenemella sanctibonifatiensis]OYN85106.1 hypothetical protein CGZ92_11625 [Parenemella sanctibonifatiensis]
MSARPDHSPENLGPAYASAAITGAYVEGNTLWTTTRFAPIVLAATDLTTGQLSHHQIPAEWGHGAWGLTVHDGTAYIGTYSPGNLVAVDTTTGRARLLTAEPIDRFLWGVEYAAGRVWAGSYPTGAAVCLDPGTGELTSSGPLRAGAAYARTLAVDPEQQVLYVGGGSPATVARVSLTDPRDVTDVTPAALAEAPTVIRIAVGPTEVAVGSDAGAPFCLLDRADPTRVQVITQGPNSDHSYDTIDAIAWLPSEDPRGEVVVSTRPAGQLLRLDRTAEAFVTLGTPVVGAETRLLWHGNGRLRGVTGTGQVWSMDLTDPSDAIKDPSAGDVTVLDLAEAGHPTLPEPLQSLLVVGDDVHLGGHFQVIVRRADGSHERFPVPGEPKRLVATAEPDGDWVTMAMYPSTEVWRYRTDAPAATLTRVGVIGHRQTRPQGMAALPDGRILITTQPSLGDPAGALTVVGAGATGGILACHVGLVPEQSLRAIAVDPTDGRVWVGSDVQGGLGSAPTHTACVVAQVDPDTGALAWQVSLPAPNCRSLAFIDGQLLASLSTGEIVALDPATGAVGVRAPAPGHTELRVADRRGEAVVLAAHPGGVALLDPATLALTDLITDADARWYTVPDAGLDSRGRLYSLVGTNLTRR